VADHFLKAGAEHAGAHEEETLETELANKKEELLKEDGTEQEGPKIWVNNDVEREPSERIINVI
jgi:hypothetical protein